MSARKWRSACLIAGVVATMAWSADALAQEPAADPQSPRIATESPDSQAPLPLPLIAPPVLPSSPPAQVPALPPPPSLSWPDATIVEWPDHRIAKLQCGTLPLTQAVCRYRDYTGVLVTYHQNGSAAEILSFAGGLLEGLCESYDYTGHLLSRQLFHVGRVVELGQSPPSFNLPVDPSLVPQQTPLQTPLQTYAQPWQHAVRMTPTPRGDGIAEDSIRGQLGIGLRASLGFLASAAVVAPYIGSLLQVIPNLHRIRPEFSVGVLYAQRDKYHRLDVPMSAGVQADLFSGADTIYFVVAAAAIYTHRFVADNVPGPTSESAWLLGGEGGIGLRLKRSPYSYWLADLRLGGLGRIDSQPRLLLPQAEEPPVVAIGSQFRMLLGLTLVGNLGL